MAGLRTTGQHSYLNAVALDKAVIVTGTIHAPFYNADGRNRPLPLQATWQRCGE
jgi:hypothetical protein